MPQPSSPNKPSEPHPALPLRGQDQHEELRKRKVQPVKGSETKKEKTLERRKTIIYIFLKVENEGFFSKGFSND